MKPNSTDFDVLIVGGGPAGMSAALWCAETGLNSALIEKESCLGGQLSWIHNPINNYIGLETANGVEMLAHFDQSLASRHFHRITGVEILEINTALPSVKLADGRTLASQNLILATGIRRRQLGVPGESEFYGNGILESGSKERKSVRGKRVVVIGGGDAAAENALILAEFAEKVFLVHRKQKLSARAEFVEMVNANSKIETILETTVKRFGSLDKLEWIELAQRQSKETFRLGIEKAVVRIGVEPNSGLLRDQLACDELGYIMVDAECRTNASRVYAIGDLANPKSPTISSAAGMAATAVKSIRKNRDDLD